MNAVQIASLALGKLGCPGITSFDDDSDEARAMKATYEAVRDAVLEARVWTFALEQHVLQPHATPPAFGFTQRYEIPSTVARVHRVWNAAGRPIYWERQGKFILTSLAPVTITTTSYQTDYIGGAELPMGLPAALVTEVTTQTTTTEKLPPKILVLAVSKADDAAVYPPAFCTALATRLAAELAVPLTENARLQADLWALYESQIREAAGSDGSQGRQERVSGSWLSRRR